jgi:hypothetical protein
MASNIFGRYVWLVDTIRQRKRLTFKQINQLWIKSGMSYGEGDDLPLRTFHNHLNAISDIFNINIKCDIKNGYTYYIEGLEQLESDSLRCWLIDSYATLNQVQADKKLEGRIIFEDIPSGHQLLTTITRAMHEKTVIEITHQGFEKECSNTFEIEPYCLKVYNRRWYVIARSLSYDSVLTYGLDRITNVVPTKKTFKMPSSFDINSYFEGCCGIISDKSIPLEKVIVKTYAYARNYVGTLPIHSSQKEIARDDESITFEYKVRPNYEFLQALLMQADQIEVLEPEWVRQELKRLVENMFNLYKDTK